MRLRHAIAAALLPIPMLFPGTVRPAAAAVDHTITITGTLTLSSGTGIFKSRSTGKAALNRKFVLRHAPGQSARTQRFAFCQAGELRGVLTINLQLTQYEYVTVTPKLQMFEGSSCSNNDLDGEQSSLMTGVSPGKQRTWNLRVHNSEALSGDLVYADFTVSNTVG